VQRAERHPPRGGLLAFFRVQASDPRGALAIGEGGGDAVEHDGAGDPIWPGGEVVPMRVVYRDNFAKPSTGRRRLSPALK
jgi:hypothetical protein